MAKRLSERVFPPSDDQSDLAMNAGAFNSVLKFILSAEAPLVSRVGLPYGLRLKDGRELDEHLQADKQAVIVNETLVKEMGWKQPLGQQFRLDSLQYSVIGVVQDFGVRTCTSRSRTSNFSTSSSSLLFFQKKNDFGLCTGDDSSRLS